MGSNAISEFVHSLKHDPDETIMEKKEMTVKKLTQAILLGIPDRAKVAGFDSSELFKGLDPTKEKDQLSCCQLILGYQAAKGSQESREALVRLNAVIWLDNLSDIKEIKREAPKILAWLKNPKAQLAEDAYKRIMNPVWNGLLMSGYIVSILVEHW